MPHESEEEEDKDDDDGDGDESSDDASETKPDPDPAPAPAAPPPARRELKSWLVALALAVVTLVAYAPVLGAGLIGYDDTSYISKNPVVPDGLTMNGLRWAATATFVANWHPLAWISHMMDVQLFGMNFTGHHFVSLLFHVVNAMLLARLLSEATGEKWKSLAVAMLFALHPMHVESVAWLAERKDVLSTFFWTLAAIGWVRWTRSRRASTYVAVCLLFALSLVSKPSTVTFPFVLVLLDLWPLGRLRVLGIGGKATATTANTADGGGNNVEISLVKAFAEKIPLFLLAFGSSVVTYKVQRSGGAVMEHTSVGAGVLNVFVSYARYAWKMVVPTDLAIVYPHPRGGFPTWMIALSVVFVVAASAMAIRAGRRRPWLFVGWFFFVGVLVPMIGVVQIGNQSLADRYSYQSFTGLFVIVVWGAAEVIAARLSPSSARNSIVAASCVVALLFASLTYRQSELYVDGLTIFRHAALVAGPNAVAQRHIGMALAKDNKMAEAEVAYRAGIDADPTDALAHTQLGILLANMRRFDDAIKEHEIALRLEPTCAPAHYHLGLVLLSKRQLKPAEAHFTRALRLQPDQPQFHSGRGFVLSEEGRYEEAMAEFKIAIALNPHNSVEARGGLGLALARAGRISEAVVVFGEVVALDPELVVARVNFGDTLVDSGRVDEGISQFRIAVRIEPENAMAHHRLASVLVAQGRTKEGIAEYREAARLDPSDEDIKRELAAAIGR